MSVSVQSGVRTQGARSAPLDRQAGGGGVVHQQQQQLVDVPVRMVVDARLVGAIIGQGGATIREITKECKARCVVDPHRSPRTDAVAGTIGMDKVISIYGQPENCSRAAVRLLAVCLQEMQKEQPSDR
jgi:hypothetical protein